MYEFLNEVSENLGCEPRGGRPFNVEYVDRLYGIVVGRSAEHAHHANRRNPGYIHRLPVDRRGFQRPKLFGKNPVPNRDQFASKKCSRERIAVEFDK